MSTPDVPGPGASGLVLPEELRLVANQTPNPTVIPSASAPTPGLALAAARLPGGPTLPDWDPTQVGTAVLRMANELFQAPTLAPAPPAGLPSAPDLPGTPPGPSLPAGSGLPLAAPATSSAPMAPSIPAAPATAATPSLPAIAAAPFSAPLRFDGIPDLSPVLATFPLVDLPREEVAPAPTSSAPPAPDLLRVSTFEIAPVSDLGLRQMGGSVFDPHAIRREFPILEERVNGRRLVWLDNAATTQKPQAVIDRLKYFYEHENSNIHRAAHTLAARATDAYESARESVKRFLNAPSKNEIIFVRGATEGINLVAQAWGRRNLKAGDEVVISWLEHHANIVPWQQVCAETGAVLRVAPVDSTGQILLDEYGKLLGPKTRLVAFTQVSNALGTVTPAKEMIELAHRHGAKVLLDGAQAVSHQRVDVQALDCDFFVFSGHKVFAPTGIGVVYGKKAELEAMVPWQGGGNMIQDVTFERTTFNPPPSRFEAGTGNIADAVGLGAALDWLSKIGVESVGSYEHGLMEYATAQLATVPGLTMIGTAPEKAGVLSFILAGQKTEEVGKLLDQEGIAVRSGHHCAQPILRRFGLEATVRASLAPYNTCEDIDALVAALLRLQAGQNAPRPT